MIKKIISSVLFVGCGLFANIDSFTQEDIKEMAKAYVDIASARVDASKVGFEDLKNMAQFRGYIAGLLDSNKESFKECYEQNTLNDISFYTASMIDGLPLKRSSSSALSVFIAINMSCERLKKKNK